MLGYFDVYTNLIWKSYVLEQIESTRKKGFNIIAILYLKQ